MKKVAMISGFCDSQKKIDVLEKNIKIIKSHNVDVIVISPFFLPKNIVDICDYFFITKDNPILEWPVKSMIYKRFWSYKEKKYRVGRSYPDYGFAALYQHKQLGEIALNLDYDKFYYTVYDLKIDNNVINGLISNDKVNNIYSFKRNESFWRTSLHFLIFNRENLKNFIFEITLEKYLKQKDGDVEKWIGNLQTKLNYVVEEIPVTDEIYYYENLDFFNYSPVEDFKFFIEKNDETLGNIKLLFYGFLGEKEINIKIGEETDSLFVYGESTNKLYIHDMYIYDLGFNKDYNKSVILEYNSINYDLTDTIKKIKHNVFFEII